MLSYLDRSIYITIVSHQMFFPIDFRFSLLRVRVRMHVRACVPTAAVSPPMMYYYYLCHLILTCCPKLQLSRACIAFPFLSTTMKARERIKEREREMETSAEKRSWLKILCAWIVVEYDSVTPLSQVLGAALLVESRRGLVPSQAKESSLFDVSRSLTHLTTAQTLQYIMGYAN